MEGPSPQTSKNNFVAVFGVKNKKVKIKKNNSLASQSLGTPGSYKVFSPAKPKVNSLPRKKKMWLFWSVFIFSVANETFVMSFSAAMWL